MRQITIEAVSAFNNGKYYNKSNTEVLTIINGHSKMYLHGNNIAEKQGNKLILRTCGWTSNTTKERLNGILDFYNLGVIRQKNFSWYLHSTNGEVIPFNNVMTFNI